MIPNCAKVLQQHLEKDRSKKECINPLILHFILLLGSNILHTRKQVDLNIFITSRTPVNGLVRDATTYLQHIKGMNQELDPRIKFSQFPNRENNATYL